MESEPIIFQGALAISFRECRLYSVDGDDKKLVTIIALHNLTYPSWGKRKIIASNMPAGRGICDRSQEGTLPKSIGWNLKMLLFPKAF